MILLNINIFVVNRLVISDKILKFAKSNFFILTFFFVIIGLAYCTLIQVSNYKFYERFMSFSEICNFLLWFIPEFLLFYYLSLLFCHKNKFIRIIFYSGFFVFLLIYLAQITSIHISNNLISTLALENISFIGLITEKRSLRFSIIAFLMGVVISISVIEFIINKRINFTKQNKIYIISISAVLFIYIIFYNFYLFGSSDKVVSFFPNYQTPAISLINNVIKVSSEATCVDTLDFDMLKKLKLHYDENSKYPFMKKKIFSEKIKFSSTKFCEKPNVIVFFCEGLAADSLNCYGSKFENLTPNINKFCKDSMKVINYYNHTATTYRGLHGQLCSIYPFHGYDEWVSNNKEKMEKTNYSSIPGILNKCGYETLFFCSENEPLSSLLRTLKFKEIYNGDKIIKELIKGREKFVKDPILDYLLTDESLFDGLITYLKKRNSEKNKNPFFIGAYNLQTHSFFKVPKGGIKYKKAKNDTLDAIHNLDVQFGKFYDYFKKSPYAKNTIIIFTTDHTSYFGDPSYRKIVSDDYQLFFISKVPLIIYDPYLNLPKEYDAKMATSIDFAPTLCNMIGLNNKENNFLGESIFERKKDYGIGAIRNRFYFIHKNRIYISKCKTDELSKIFKTNIEYIKKFYLMEAKNRVFKKSQKI